MKLKVDIEDILFDNAYNLTIDGMVDYADFTLIDDELEELYEEIGKFLEEQKKGREENG